jgi:hypothetical protein
MSMRRLQSLHLHSPFFRTGRPWARCQLSLHLLPCDRTVPRWQCLGAILCECSISLILFYILTMIHRASIGMTSQSSTPSSPSTWPSKSMSPHSFLPTPSSSFISRWSTMIPMVAHSSSRTNSWSLTFLTLGCNTTR